MSSSKKKKYRSKVREQPRILYPVGYWDENPDEKAEASQGQLSYQSTGPKLLDIFNISINLSLTDLHLIRSNINRTFI